MTLPRQVLPLTAMMVTRRCVQRQFLLRPDPEMNNAFIYCLAVAAQRYRITVMNFVQMSNHLHDAIFDRHGNSPEFFRYFHRLLAVCVNSTRRRRESVFNQAEQVSVVTLPSVEALVDKLVYVATNPVNADLVARVDDWPGASGIRALLAGRTLRATRPRCFSKTGILPSEVVLELSIPDEFGNRDTILAAVEAEVARVEREAAERRARTGVTVLGRYAVRRQAWRAAALSTSPRGNLSPRVATRNRLLRIEALQRHAEFLASYRVARIALLAGSPVPFPTGTYWLVRYAGVAVVSSENTN